MSAAPKFPPLYAHRGMTTRMAFVTLTPTLEEESRSAVATIWPEAGDAFALARLFAAAPALFEALRMCSETLDCACSVKERDSGHRVGCPVPETRAAIDAALAKASS